MVVLSSPSGAVNLLNQFILKSNNNYLISVSHTTRKPRINEIEAKDYFFVNEDQFKSLVKNNEFLEYAKVFHHYYGTSKPFVIESLEKGKNVVFDIDWQGTEQIKEKKLKYKLITFFILPPSKKALFERLSNRDMKDKLIVEERMNQFSNDVLHWKNYNYVVINDDLERCYNEVSGLIESELKNTTNKYDVKLIEKHISQLID